MPDWIAGQEEVEKIQRRLSPLLLPKLTITLQGKLVPNEGKHRVTLRGGEGKLGTAAALLQLVNLRLEGNCLVLLAEVVALLGR